MNSWDSSCRPNKEIARCLMTSRRAGETPKKCVISLPSVKALCLQAARKSGLINNDTTIFAAENGKTIRWKKCEWGSYCYYHYFYEEMKNNLLRLFPRNPKFLDKRPIEKTLEASYEAFGTVKTGKNFVHNREISCNEDLYKPPNLLIDYAPLDFCGVMTTEKKDFIAEMLRNHSAKSVRLALTLNLEDRTHAVKRAALNGFSNLCNHGIKLVRKNRNVNKTKETLALIEQMPVGTADTLYGSIALINEAIEASGYAYRATDIYAYFDTHWMLFFQCKCWKKT